MDLKTFQDTWQEFEVTLEGGQTFALKDRFFLCIGPHAGGLLFDTGGPQGAPAYTLKVDEDDNLWIRSKAPGDGPEEEAWTKVGPLTKIADN